MSIYKDSEYQVRTDLADIHASQLEQLGEPGTWGSGQQRLAIVAEARKAGYDAGALEAPDNGGAPIEVELPEVACKVVQLLAVSPKDFNEAAYNNAKSGGLSDEEYVEIVGIVARLSSLDIFARGIGVPLRPLPSAKPGEPSRERPEVATKEEAWVPTIPNPPEGGEAAEEHYAGQPKPYIVRALSVVPEEMHRHVELEEIQYLPLRHIMEPDYQHHEGFSRAQVELVAGRVSALNECFYWTTGHARFLRESGRVNDLDYNLEALVNPNVDSGVEGGKELLAFSDAVIGTDRSVLDHARAAVANTLGATAVPAAAAIAATFSKNDRIANGCGIPADPLILKLTKDFRGQLGLDDFRSAVNTFKHFPGA